MEQKEFAFRTYVESVTHISRLFEGALQDIPWVSLERRPVRAVYVTYQSGFPAAVEMPGEDFKGIRIGIKEHVGFLDPGKSVNRRAIKHEPVLQGVLQMVHGNSHVFCHAKKIGKLQ